MDASRLSHLHSDDTCPCYAIAFADGTAGIYGLDAATADDLGSHPGVTALHRLTHRSPWTFDAYKLSL
jgi:hypothetical protein